MSFNPFGSGTDWGPIPFGLFNQMFQGNWVAWTCFALGIGFIGSVIAYLILWWKLPSYAKAGVKNETFGAHNPTFAMALESKKLLFSNPQMLYGGFAYDERNGIVSIPPKRWASDLADLGKENQELLTDVYTIEGSNSPFYVGYSVQAALVNPKFSAVMEYEAKMQKIQFSNPGGLSEPVVVSKKLFLAAIASIPGDTVNFKSFYFHFPTDIRKLKEVLPLSLSQSSFGEFENHIRQNERKRQGGQKTNLILLCIGAVAINILITIILHFV